MMRSVRFLLAAAVPGPWANPRIALISSAIAIVGCGNSEVGSVPKLPPRSEIQKQIEFPALKAGAKLSKGQLAGLKKDS